MMLLIQSCGVIEKRRYSSGWNLNLSVGHDKGKVAKIPVKKKLNVNLNNDEMPADWASNNDTISQTRTVFESVNKSELYELNEGLKYPALHNYKPIEESPHRFNLNGIQNLAVDIDSTLTANHTPVKKNEPFAAIALIAIALGVIGVVGLIMNTIIVIYTGIVLYEVFLTLTMVGFPVAILSTLISHYKFRSKRIRDRFKNRNMYVLSKTILLLMFLAGYVTLLILVSTI
ncbi:MAG TPA: hypothetical protein VGF79_11920 [Bacteroidia bacterium]